MLRLFRSPEMRRMTGAAAGLGLAASLLLQGCGAAEPFLNKLHATPTAEAVDCKATLKWLGQYTVQVTVSDPAITSHETLDQVKLDWGDGTAEMTYLPPDGNDPTSEEPAPQHLYVPGIGVYTIKATVEIAEGGTVYDRTDDACLVTVQVPHGGSTATPSIG